MMIVRFFTFMYRIGSPLFSLDGSTSGVHV